MSFNLAMLRRTKASAWHISGNVGFSCRPPAPSRRVARPRRRAAAPSRRSAVAPSPSTAEVAAPAPDRDGYAFSCTNTRDPSHRKMTAIPTATAMPSTTIVLK